MSQTHTPGGEWTPARILHLAEASEVDYAVRACNAHDDLVAALKAFFEASWDALGDLYGDRFSINDNDTSDRARAIRAYVNASDAVKAALAKVGEK